ncbi:anti-sigma factor [Arthrobacter sp. MYb224]|uniref:anti-sigma factor family protein n=1 Tax=Arthrobacter sp. MYb224 TaxID=1848600 RepID=UPI0015E3A3A4|nr:zf-HC2 domain-containing protein [Arthrobacter sp. MYb224]
MNEHLDLGAYVLGGLSPDERAAFELHLSGCLECQQEMAAFAPVASRLGSVDAGTARTLLEPRPTEPEARDEVDLLDSLRARRRSRRLIQRSAIAVAVAASVAAGVFLAPVVRPSPAPDASYEVVGLTGQQVGLGLNAKAWGTELRFEGSGLPTQGTLSLWVVDSTGAVDQAGAWSATTTGKTQMTCAVPVQLEEIASIQLRDVDSKVLAELHLPAHPAPQPS